MQRILGGLVMALVMLATPAMAQDADASKRLALAHRFIELMQADQMVEAIAVMTTTIAPTELEGMTREEAAEFNAAVLEMTRAAMPRMFDAMAPIYAEIFTLEELEALVAFYESDIGQAMIRKSYAAAPRMAEAIQAVMPEIMADMADSLCDRYSCTPDERREMKAAMAGVLGPAR